MRLAIAFFAFALLIAAIQTPNKPIEISADAPDWSLPANDGQTYTLSELTKERAVVVAWYPKAYTAGCTIECKSLKEKGHLIREFDVDYFMASVDTLEEVTGFADAQAADFPLIADTSKATAIEYDVLNSGGYANRINVYVGTNGKVLAVDAGVNPRTAAEDIANRLAELDIPKKETDDSAENTDSETEEAAAE